MIVDVGLRIEHQIQVLEVPLEIRDQHLDRGRRVAVADGADRRGPDAGAAILQFVAGHARDDAVLQIHLRHGIGDAGGFAEIELRRTAGLDRAEIAGARADVAQNHHRGCAAGPALAQVWALGALADRVELVLVHEFAHGLVAGTGGQFGAEPGGFAGGVHQREGESVEIPDMNAHQF